MMRSRGDDSESIRSTDQLEALFGIAFSTVAAKSVPSCCGLSDSVLRPHLQITREERPLPSQAPPSSTTIASCVREANRIWAAIRDEVAFEGTKVVMTW